MTNKVTVTAILDDIKRDICDNYCKIPGQYTEEEWDEVAFEEDGPCNKCPLNRL